jgi:hypothetical protein
MNPVGVTPRKRMQHSSNHPIGTLFPGRLEKGRSDIDLLNTDMTWQRTENGSYVTTMPFFVRPGVPGL